MEPNERMSRTTILVLGATGYVGGRLVPRLLQAGYRVRAASRSTQKLKSRNWASDPNVELCSVDVTNVASLQKAAEGCHAVYYLVHSMDPTTKDFAETDRLAAHNMVQVAEQVGLERIIYLSGLGEDDADLSEHLKSRTEVARILTTGGVPVTVLRAAMIIGSGSASFEILRYLVDRLPVMITPKWLSTPCQPIAIRNVLNYLLGCLQHPETTGQTYDIGGHDILTYRELMEIYSDEAGLGRRWIIPIPFFTPKLSSYWINLVTPVSASIARPLAEGLRNPVVCAESRILDIIPQELLSTRDAIRLALDNILGQNVESHWTDAGFLPPVETRYPGDPDWAGGTIFKDHRLIEVEGSVEDLWHAIVRIGGQTGWYYGDWLWALRGLLDKLFGGVGSHRGRRHPERVYPGDALDFWRVLNVDAPQRLRLLAEMKVPGLAVLEFNITPLENGRLELAQTAWFAPRGLSGLLYWYAVAPLHDLIFNGMLRGIAKASHHPIIKGPVRMD
ncbi:SDR family oxidoreductase [Vampirovibrio sp.]|uniref:SDR family oxidoreductase n=1 Tax=Vampirovibrio sp. TaxID=2717857 RepID=UPI003593806B